MKLVAFELSMPCAASWNGKWSGDEHPIVGIRETKFTDSAGHREAEKMEERRMKNSKYIFKAIPRPGILDANDYSDDVPQAELTGYDGTYVYGWYVDGFIVGQVMDYHDEYIALEYWVPVDPETVCLVKGDLE